MSQETHKKCARGGNKHTYSPNIPLLFLLTPVLFWPAVSSATLVLRGGSVSKSICSWYAHEMLWLMKWKPKSSWIPWQALCKGRWLLSFPSCFLLHETWPRWLELQQPPWIMRQSKMEAKKEKIKGAWVFDDCGVIKNKHLYCSGCWRG